MLMCCRWSFWSFRWSISFCYFLKACVICFMHKLAHFCSPQSDNLCLRQKSLDFDQDGYGAPKVCNFILSWRTSRNVAKIEKQWSRLFFLSTGLKVRQVLYMISTNDLACTAGVPIRFQQDLFRSRIGVRKKASDGEGFPHTSPTQTNLANTVEPRYLELSRVLKNSSR